MGLLSNPSRRPSIMEIQTAERLGTPITGAYGQAPPMGNINRQQMNNDWAANSGDWQATQANARAGRHADALANSSPTSQAPHVNDNVTTTTTPKNDGGSAQVTDWYANPPPTNVGYAPSRYQPPAQPSNVMQPAVGNTGGLAGGGTTPHASVAGSQLQPINVMQSAVGSATPTSYTAAKSQTAPAVTAHTWDASNNQATANDYNVSGFDMTSPDASGRNGVVEDRLTNMVGKDSDYMQLARTKALQSMNAKGTANSSMAIGAGHSAAISAAMPIASADAAAFNQAGLANKGAENAALADNTASANQFALSNQAVGVRADEGNSAALNAADQFNVNNQQQRDLTNQQYENEAAMRNTGAANEFARANQEALNTSASDFAKATNAASIEAAGNQLKLLLADTEESLNNYKTDTARRTALDEIASGLVKSGVSAGIFATPEGGANWLSMIGDLYPDMGLSVTTNLADTAATQVV